MEFMCATMSAVRGLSLRIEGMFIVISRCAEFVTLFPDLSKAQEYRSFSGSAVQARTASPFAIDCGKKCDLGHVGPYDGRVLTCRFSGGRMKSIRWKRRNVSVRRSLVFAPSNRE